MESKDLFTWKQAPPWAPGVCFLCLFFSNCVFSYSNLSLLWKMEIGLFFFVLPLSALVGWNLRARPLPEANFSVSPWLWAFLLGGALLLRIYRLDFLSSWPVVDEGRYGYFATRLEQGWNWNLAHSPLYISSVYCWILYVSFRLFHNSLLSLWLPPALLGWGCLLFFPFLNRKIVPVSTALYSLGWMAFGFWPLYLGRFSNQATFFVFWECLVLAVLLSCLEGSTVDSSPKGWWRWGGLALLTGLGFYTYLVWPMAVLLVFAIFFSRWMGPWSLRLLKNPITDGFFNAPRLRLGALVLFTLGVLLPALPLLVSMSRNYQYYLQHLWAFGTPEPFWERFRLPAAYLKGIFWGFPQPGHFSLGPLWGGLLSPVQTACFSLGAVSLSKPACRTAGAWLAAAMAVFSVPAFLTNNLEFTRLCGLVPFLAYVSALGVRELVAAFPPRKAAVVFSLFLTGSLLLDAHQLFQVYPEVQKSFPGYYGLHKSPEHEEAYVLLKPLAQKEGPGLLLLNGVPDPFDQTLFAASYSFNAAQNRQLNPQSASWAAILANIHEQPYLSKIFPGMEWKWLSEGLQREDGGLMLAVIPIDEASGDRIRRWAQADRSLEALTDSVMEFGVDPDQSRMLGILERAYPFFKGDRILESRYWRLWAIHQAAAGRMDLAVQGEEKAVRLGYPMAHLYNEWGCLLFKEGRPADSRKAFGEALRLNPNCTNAAVNLHNLSLPQNQ